MSGTASAAVTGTAPRSDLDAVVAEIWAEELGVETVETDKTFDELAGTPEVAERIQARLCDDLQVRLAPGLIHGAQTVMKATDQITRSRYNGNQHPTMVTVQAGGDRPPLFCVGGGGGYAFNFQSLARSLDPQQPVYAFHARGLERRARTCWSVTEHARWHLAAIRSVQPTGPYRLLGYSFGGLVVYEIAQQLRASGEEVAHLALVDPPLPAPDRASRARKHSSLFGQCAAAVVASMRLTGPLGKIKSCFLPLVGLVRFPGKHNTDMFWLWSAVVIDMYPITPYVGAATLYRAESDSHAPARRWDELLNDAAHVPVPGDHNTMVRRGNVDRLAVDLAARLEQYSGVQSHGQADFDAS